MQEGKHPDWDTVYKLVFSGAGIRRAELRDFAKSHDLNTCVSAQGNTILMHAVKVNDEALVLELANFSIDPNVKNIDGLTALQLLGGKANKCSLPLLEHFLCIDFHRARVRPSGLDALFANIYQSCYSLGNTSSVADDGNEVNSAGYTALMCAAQYGCSNAIRALHERFPKLNPNITNRNGLTALELAVKHGYVLCISMLSECFPSLQIKSALIVACDYNRQACIEELYKCFPCLDVNTRGKHNTTALIVAAWRNNHVCIRLLRTLFPNVDVNLQDNFGNSALIATVKHALTAESVPILFECFPNIDPNLQDQDGNSALLCVASDSQHNQSGIQSSAQNRRREIDFISHLRQCSTTLDYNAQNTKGDSILIRLIRANCSPKVVSALATAFPFIHANMRNVLGETALIAAARNENIALLVALLDAFPSISPNTQDDDGNTALLLAAKFNNTEAVATLIARFPSIDVNIQNNQGKSVLLYATANHNSEIIVILRDSCSNVDPNLRDENNFSPLINTMNGGNIEFIRLFCQSFDNINPNVTSSTGRSPLLLAIESNQNDIILFLLGHFPQQIDVNSRGKNDITALIQATKHSRLDIISLLSENFANIDPNIADANGHTALHHAVMRNDLSCIAALQQQFHSLNYEACDHEWLTPLGLAISLGNDKSIVFLIQNFPRINIDTYTTDSTTALMYAAKWDRPDIISLLSACSPNRYDSDGNTALHHAVIQGNTACIKMLQATFPALNPNKFNEQKMTPLLVGIHLNNNNAIFSLLFYFKSKVDVSVCTSRGIDILMHIAQHSHLDILALLSNDFAHINPNRQDRDGYTALHHSIMAKGPANTIVARTQALWQHFPNIDPNISNSKGETALILAVASQNVSMISSLKNHFPKTIEPNSLTNYGLSALTLAIHHNRLDCVKALLTAFPYPHTLAQIGQFAFIEAVQRSAFHFMTVIYNHFPDIDPNQQSESGRTALMVALKHHRQSKKQSPIELLLQRFRNIDPNITTPDGRSALQIAVENDDPQAIRTLHHHFPNITAQNALLRMAVKKSSAACIRALGECFPSIDPNVVIKGESPLSICVRAFVDTSNKQASQPQHHKHTSKSKNEPTPQIYLDCIRALGETFPKIDPNVPIHTQLTPLMIAMSMPGSSLLQCLVQSFPSLDPDIQNHKKQTALMIGAEHICESSQPGKALLGLINQLLKSYPQMSLEFIPPKRPILEQTPLILTMLRFSPILLKKGPQYLRIFIARRDLRMIKLILLALSHYKDKTVIFPPFSQLEKSHLPSPSQTMSFSLLSLDSDSEFEEE